MAMRVRKHVPSQTTGVVSELLHPTSRLVQPITGLPLQRNKAIVGDNAFAHERHLSTRCDQESETYEIMTPASVGVPATEMVLGKHSRPGAASVRVGLRVGQ